MHHAVHRRDLSFRRPLHDVRRLGAWPMKGGLFGRGTSRFGRTGTPSPGARAVPVLDFYPRSSAEVAALFDDIFLDSRATYPPVEPVEPVALPAALDAVDFVRVSGIVVGVENETAFRAPKSTGGGVTSSRAGRTQDRRRATKKTLRLSTTVESLEEGEAMANLLEGYGHVCRFDDGTAETASGIFPDLNNCWLDPVGGRFGTGCLVIPPVSSGGQAEWIPDYVSSDWTVFVVLFDALDGVWRTVLIRSDGLYLVDGDEPDDTSPSVPWRAAVIPYFSTTARFSLLGYDRDGLGAELRVDEFALFPWLMPDGMIEDLLDNVDEDKVSPLPELHVTGRVLGGLVGVVGEGRAASAKYEQRGGQPEGWENNALVVEGEIVEVRRLDSVDDTPLPTLYAPLALATRVGDDTRDVAGGRLGAVTGNLFDVLGFDDVADNAMQAQGDPGDVVDFGDDGTLEGHAGSTGRMSFACWFNSLDDGVIASKWREGSNEREWMLTVNLGIPRLFVSDPLGLNMLEVLFAADFGVGGWTFLAFTFNLDAVNRASTDYVRAWGRNGRKVSTTTTPTGTFVGMTGTAAPLRLFNSADGNRPLAGAMQHAALWSGVELTAAEVRTIYRATRLGRRLRRV